MLAVLEPRSQYNFILILGGKLNVLTGQLYGSLQRDSLPLIFIRLAL